MTTDETTTPYLCSVAGEIAKGIIRELFFMRTQMIDGACAAMLHLTQSAKVKDYYKNRHMRLRASTSDFTHLRQ